MTPRSFKIALRAGTSLPYIALSMWRQKIKKAPLLFVEMLAILSLLGCPEDNPVIPPTPDLLSKPEISLNDDSGQFYTAVVVTLTFSQTLDSAWANIYLIAVDSTDTDSLFLSPTLKDDGTGGDILPNDDLFGATTDSPLSGGTGGDVRVDFMVSVNGVTSTISDTLPLANLKPVIISVTAASMLILPEEGSEFKTIDTLRVLVADADGLADIRSVSFTTLKPDSTLANSGNAIALADNGDATYGDDVEDDGIYSRIIQLSESNSAGTYVYRFVATDWSGNRSDTTTHTTVVIDSVVSE